MKRKQKHRKNVTGSIAIFLSLAILLLNADYVAAGTSGCENIPQVKYIQYHNSNTREMNREEQEMLQKYQLQNIEYVSVNQILDMCYVIDEIQYDDMTLTIYESDCLSDYLPVGAKVTGIDKLFYLHIYYRMPDGTQVVMDLYDDICDLYVYDESSDTCYEYARNAALVHENFRYGDYEVISDEYMEYIKNNIWKEEGNVLLDA